MSEENSKKVEEIRRKQCNRECMNCKEKGTTYIVTNFGVFVCSKCAGLHRELGHRVKGIGMCKFTNDEVSLLQKWGNENATKVYLKNFKKSLYPIPSPKDTFKLKEYMKVVYEQKRFYEEEEEEDSEEEEEEEKPPKEEKKVKKIVSPPKPVPAVKPVEPVKKKPQPVEKEESKPSVQELTDWLNLGGSEPVDFSAPSAGKAPAWTAFPNPPAEPAPAPKPVDPKNDLSGFSQAFSQPPKPTPAVSVPTYPTPAANPSMPPAADPFSILSNTPAPTPSLMGPHLTSAVSNHMMMFCNQYKIAPQLYATIANNIAPSISMKPTYSYAASSYSVPGLPEGRKSTPNRIITGTAPNPFETDANNPFNLL